MEKQQQQQQFPVGKITVENLTRLFRPDSEKYLGQGSYGKVFRVFYLPSGEKFALKIMKKVSPERTKRMLDEIRIGMNMDYRSICKIHCFAEDDGAIYIIMDLIDGCNLFEFLGRYPGIFLRDTTLFWTLAFYLINAIDYIHSLETVHCDIKPENVMVQILNDRLQFIKVIDFGFCQDVSDVHRFNGGTSNYMAPEIVLRRSRGYGRDIWAYGITLFVAITLHFPSQLESKNPDNEEKNEEVRKNLRELGSMPSDQQFDPFSDPVRDYSAIPDEIKTFIRSCLVVDQTSRPSASDLMQIVRKILSSFEEKSEA
jgi:serine/threonine protein kinase